MTHEKQNPKQESGPQQPKQPQSSDQQDQKPSQASQQQGSERDPRSKDPQKNQRRNRGFQIRLPREVAIFRFVEGALWESRRAARSVKAPKSFPIVPANCPDGNPKPRLDLKNGESR
jgi:hypothetical protein